MTDPTALAEWVWYGRGPGAAAVRTMLAPAAAAYGALTAARGALYDRRRLASRALALPSISVGNVSVGGTGKTPVAAWLAAQLVRRGERPAVVLRGYGDDEVLVHRALTPGAVVVADADRVRGTQRAREEGATVAVLDDAFQHRRAHRDVDLVLVSADRWGGPVRLLPAGPYREPLRALRRASLAVVTRKAAADGAVAATLAAIAAHAPALPTAVVRLAPGDVAAWGGGEHQPAATLSGRLVLAISAIGDPAAFEAQIAALGARLAPRRFRDHHAFGADDAGRLADAARRLGALPLCTLKDAVKLGPLWPREVHPLWYVSQRVIVERGAVELARAVGTALRSGGA